jgi:hypothetical protein
MAPSMTEKHNLRRGKVHLRLDSQSASFAMDSAEEAAERDEVQL